MKFDINIREKIINKADLIEYPTYCTIFKQGDYGDKMYIILKGSVNVVIHYNDPITGKPVSKTVAWMRDGSSFGEYAMLGSKSRASKDNVFTSISKLGNDISNRMIYLKKSILYQQDIDLKANNLVETWKKKKADEEAAKYDPNFKAAAQPAYQERTKRAADIVVAEDILLFELSREYFREIILENIKDEYERKMRILADLPLFKVGYAHTRSMNFLP
jgi:CRP-like cAMP-binding protein